MSSLVTQTPNQKPLPDLKTIIFLGLGFEAQNALPFFIEHYPNARIIAADINPAQCEAVASLGAQHTDFTALAQHELNDIIDGIADASTTLMVRAAGIRLDQELVEKADRHTIQHITALGFWLAYCAPKTTITITGSKGKSTTTALTAHILNHMGKNAHIIGNIGVSPFGLEWSENDIAVVEMSSFQISDCIKAGDIHCIGNLYDEHIDWHGTHENYRATKMRPFTFDAPIHGVVTKALSPYVPEGTDYSIIEDCVKIEDGRLRLYDVVSTSMKDIPEVFYREPLQQNLINALAIIVAGEVVNIPMLGEKLGEILSRFKGLPHRREVIGEYAGRLWVDDVFATIPEASLMGLNQYPSQTIRLIVGGKYRGQNFEHFADAIKGSEGIYIYSYDSAGDYLLSLKPDHIQNFKTLEDALQKAFDESEKDDVILFSPGAPSSPPHVSYKDRSKIFIDFAKKQA